MTDKMRMQTLHEQGLGAKAIIAPYPDKQWKLSTVKIICRVDEMGSALEHRKGSGRPKSVRTPTNIDRVDELICHRKATSVSISVLGEFQQS